MARAADGFQLFRAFVADFTTTRNRVQDELSVGLTEKGAEPEHVLRTDDAAEAREPVRELVEAIRLVSETGRLQIEVRDELGGILHLAEGAGNSTGADIEINATPEQIKRDAEARIGHGVTHADGSRRSRC